MPITPRPIESIPSRGVFMGLYGPTGVGKTVTLMKYILTKRMLYMKTENRNPHTSMDVAERDLKKHPVDVIDYPGDFEEFLGFISDERNFDPYDAIMLDSTTHLMNMDLSQAIENETFEALKDEEKSKRRLIRQTKKEFDGWGALAGQMFRILDPLAKRANEGTGKIVVCTFLHDSSPSWGREHINAPLVDGKKFGDNMGGFFDYIGFLEERFNEDGKQVFPPLVHFSGMPYTYCKWTGRVPKPLEGKDLVAPVDVVLKYIMKTRGFEVE